MRLIAGLFLLLITLPAAAQNPFRDLAPLELEQRAWHATTPEVTGFSLHARRAVPLHFLLPNVSYDSRLHLAEIAIGARGFGEDRDASLGWGLTAMDLFVSRQPWAGQVTLLRLDRTGITQAESDWLYVQAGPSLLLGAFDRTLNIRAMAGAGLTTLGHAGAVWLAPKSASSGLGTSLVASAVAQPSWRLTLTAEGGRKWVFGGADPFYTYWEAGARIKLNQRFSLDLNAGMLEADSDRLQADSGWILGAGLVVMPRGAGF
ncbi:MAG: hypothetical protein JJ896_17460 [Rhodothermales bacterium]|nr:hypothetical protein [Rhodothermales bacterium]MBO6781450.1 hypothetical protein [Rhodothermales bacterium]